MGDEATDQGPQVQLSEDKSTSTTQLTEDVERSKTNNSGYSQTSEKT